MKNKSFFLATIIFICLHVCSWAQAPTFEWAKAMGGAGYNVSNSIAVDDSGNVYTTGNFDGTVDFDPGPGVFNLTAVTGDDFFISKLDTGGNFVWAKAIGGIQNEYSNSIVLDNSGNLIITGRFQNTVDFNPGPGTSNLTSFGGNDIFVLKLSLAGNFVWVKQMGGASSNDYGNFITLDPSGNILTTGYFTGSADFNPGAGTFNLTTTGGSNTVFISKLDPNGNFILAAALGGNTGAIGYSIATDLAGNMFTTGYFGGTADFDPGAGTFNLNASDFQNIFISKLDNAGNFLWAKSFGASGDDRGYSICVDDTGNVYTAGHFAGTVDFNPGAPVFNLTSAGGADIFVLKLTALGNFAWAKKMGGFYSDYNYSMCFDDMGNILTTGRFAGVVDFNPGAGTFNLNSVSNSNDIFISKLDASGNFAWAKGMGGTMDDIGMCITHDVLGNVYTTGYFNDIVDFDPGPGTFNLTSAGSVDIFVHKMNDCLSLLQPGTILGGPVVCQDSSATFSIPPVIGATNYTWTLPAGWTGTSTTNSIFVTAGTSGGTISVTAHNFCNSSLPQTLNVTVNMPPGLPSVISGNTTVCSGSSNTYSIGSVMGATSYTWVLPNGWIGSSTTNSISTTAGTVSGNISVMANNACGSSPLQILNILVDTILPTINDSINGNDSICSGSSNTYNIAPVIGAISYSWTLPAGWIGNSVTNSIITTAGATSGNISVTANNACGASLPQTVFINVNNTLNVGFILSGNDTICFGDSITLNGTGADFYSWTGGIVDSVRFMPVASDSYIVTGSNGLCADTASVNIVVYSPNVSYTAMPNDSACTGGSITLSGTGATSYTWIGGINNGVVFTPANSFTYTLIGTDSFGCIDSALAPVVVVPDPNVNLGADIVQSLVPAILNAGSGFASYYWSTTQTTQGIAVTAGGQYIVTVTNSFGCVDSDTIQVIFTTGIFNLDGTPTQINLFPNPTSNGVFNLSIQNIQTSNLQFDILDLKGNLLLCKQMGPLNGNLIESFKLTDYAVGTYILRITANNQSTQVKFVINN